jgi:hypothetical protein
MPSCCRIVTLLHCCCRIVVSSHCRALTGMSSCRRVIASSHLFASSRRCIVALSCHHVIASSHLRVTVHVLSIMSLHRRVVASLHRRVIASSRLRIVASSCRHSSHLRAFASLHRRVAWSLCHGKQIGKLRPTLVMPVNAASCHRVASPRHCVILRTFICMLHIIIFFTSGANSGDGVQYAAVASGVELPVSGVPT